MSDITLVPDDLSDNSIHSEKRSDKKLPGSKPMQEQVEKRDILVGQPKAVADLAFISSAPRNVTIVNYVYTTAAGEGITVYIIDSDLHLVLSKDGSMPMASPKQRLMTIPVRHASKVAGRVLGKVISLQTSSPRMDEIFPD